MSDGGEPHLDGSHLVKPGDPEQGHSLLSRISTQMVRAFKQYFGKGPVSAKSYLVDDLLFIVMRGGLTQAEQTLVDAGCEDAVRRFRQDFQDQMEGALTYMVEQLTGRRVVSYQSQILFNPHINVEIFAFDDEAGSDQLQETARAISHPEAGTAHEDEVEPPEARPA